MRRTLGVVCIGVLAAGCGLVVGLDPYRNCAGQECQATTSDAAADTNGLDSGAACSTSDDCRTAPNGAAVCSGGFCRQILTLAQGASTHSCVVLSNHTVRCWGDNQDGELGMGDSNLHALPQTVLNDQGAVLTDVVDVTLGWGHTCALISNGDVYCWGKNDAGQLGLGTSVLGASKATKVGGLAGRKALQISSGLGGPVCALTTNGVSTATQVYCWGNAEYGQIGDPRPDSGTLTPHFTPVLLPAPTDVKAIAAGAHQVCVQTASALGKLTCWGDGWLGVLDNGHPTEPLGNYPPHYPFEKNTFTVDNDNPIDEFRLGEEHMCARIGNVPYCWGGDYFGMASAKGGDGNNGIEWLSKPARPIGVGSATALSPSWRGTCIVADGTAKCWGMTQDYELGLAWGLPLVGVKQVPLVVDNNGLTVVAVALHVLFGCALTDQGNVYCWGQGAGGQLGDGTLVQSRLPKTTLPVAL